LLAVGGEAVDVLSSVELPELQRVELAASSAGGRVLAPITPVKTATSKFDSSHCNSMNYFNSVS
jgi:hypothetical protein